MSEELEVVIGATRKGLKVTFRDSVTKALVPITGGTVRLQGQSDDLPDKDLDVAGVIFDGPGAVGRWADLGGSGFLQPTDLGGKPSALYRLRPKFTDSSLKSDYGGEILVRWVRPPV